jgi:hypothetical protein
MRSIVILLVAFLASTAAFATPAQIIILRHGEKANPYALCGIGQQRSLALAAQYLGDGASNSLFASGTSPSAFLTITLHTIELASPAAQTWKLPLTAYSAMPLPKGGTFGDSDAVLNARTQEAAADVLANPAWNGKTVVMVWEHKHIANKKLEKQYAPAKVTLRQLLNLDTLGSQVPDKWEGGNYDYFWVVTYGNSGSQNPTAFQAIRQDFTGAFHALPHNKWGDSEKLPKGSGCES